MLKRRRLAIGPSVEAVFPDSLGNWRDPSNDRWVWREVRVTDRQTAEVPEGLFGVPADETSPKSVPGS